MKDIPRGIEDFAFCIIFLQLLVVAGLMIHSKYGSRLKARREKDGSCKGKNDGKPREFRRSHT